MNPISDAPLDLGAIARRWSRYGGMGNDRSVGDSTDALIRTLAHYSANDVPALIAEIQRLRAHEIGTDEDGQT